MIALVAAALLGSVPVALAHIPHDTVLAAAVPADLDPTVPWFVLANPHEIPLWERSDDAGRTWNVTYASPTADIDLLGATRLSDGTLVVLGARRYWWTVDEGASWSWDRLPGDVTLVGGVDRLILAGAGGVWGGVPGSLGREASMGVTALGPGPTAVDSSGRVWTGDGGAWEDLGTPGGAATAAVAGEAGVWAGTADGAVARYGADGWSTCGEEPALAAEGRDRTVVRMALDGASLYVAEAWRGPFVSTDGCATWDARETPGDPVLGGDGGATSAMTTWLSMVATGGRVLLVGWGGVFHSEDSGRTWAHAPTVSSAYTRGLAFSPDYAADGTVYLGTYGAAIVAVTDLGLSHAPRDGGFLDTNNQQVATPTDPAYADDLWAVQNHEGWYSHDAGRTWTDSGIASDRVGRFDLDPTGRDVWAFALVQGDGQTIVHTHDGGAGWDTVSTLVATLGDARGTSSAALDDGTVAGTRCVAGGVEVWCSGDAGVTWVPRWRGQGTVASDLVSWPPGRPTRLLVGDETGVHRTDDLGHTWQRWPIDGEDLPLTFGVAPDGLLFLGTSGGRVLRSEDGGRTFDDLGLRLPDQIRVLAVRPDEADPAQPAELLVGCGDGTWVVHDIRGAAPTWERWGSYERVDDNSGFVAYGGEERPVDDPEAGMGQRHALGVAATAETWLRGTHFQVLGLASSADAAELYVDGALVDTLAGEAVDGVLLSAEGYEWGWHELVVRGVAGAGVEVDAVEGLGDDGLLTPREPVGAVGCTSAPGPRGRGALVGMGLVLLVRRRGGVRRPAVVRRRGAAGATGAR